MKLDYNILWFEDIKSSFDTKKKIVRDIVESLGFNFLEPRNETDGSNIESIDYSDFDLLIVDLNLAGVRGPSLIDKIRHGHDVYTEVIFYSSDGERAVRDALREYEIDGAYCAGRENDDFEEKVGKVIRTTIKKVQDVNNMRGLIMAETSDIDKTMLEIITAVIEKDKFGIKNEVIKSIYDSVQSKVNNKKDDFDKYRKNDKIDKVVKDNLMFDSHQKIIALQKIIDLIDHEVTTPLKNATFHNEYKKVKTNRDLLAHVTPMVVDGKKILKSGISEIEFSEDYCNNIRNAIKTHSGTLTEILALVSP